MKRTLIVTFYDDKTKKFILDIENGKPDLKICEKFLEFWTVQGEYNCYTMSLIKSYILE